MRRVVRQALSVVPVASLNLRRSVCGAMSKRYAQEVNENCALETFSSR